jgi:hypothetical protein
MKWTNEVISEIKEHIKNGKGYREISDLTNINWNSIRIKMGRLGEGVDKNKPKIIKHCIECNGEIKNDGLKFCSSSCSATHNNKLRPKKIETNNINENINKRKRDNYHLRKNKTCINCNTITTNKYCGSKCQNEYRINLIFEKIESGDLTLNTRQYRKYLISKHGCKCMECGWDKINKTSGKVPIELEHIDGDSTNNNLENLKLLCPNCHSLTPTYKALNKGNGRHSRMLRYNKGKSY